MLVNEDESDFKDGTHGPQILLLRIWSEHHGKISVTNIYKGWCFQLKIRFELLFAGTQKKGRWNS